MTQPAPRQLPRLQPPTTTPLLAVPSDDLPPLYTIPEAARLLRVPEGWLRKKITASAVPHTRLGKHVRLTADHLRQIITAGEQTPPAPPATVGAGLSPRARRPRPVA